MIGRIIRKIARQCGFERPIHLTANLNIVAPNQILVGKKIIITGGTKGVGLAMAQKFISEGAEVLITGRDFAATEKVAYKIGCKALALNLHDIQSFQNFVKEAAKILGGIDCLVNNAGISLHEKSFFDVTPDTFEAQFCTNLEGPFFLTQNVVKYMTQNNRKGDILFISSETGFTADVRPYGLTKVAINSLTQGLAYLLCHSNIRVNAIAPGVVATDMTGHSPTGNLYNTLNYIGRLYLPEEMAEIAAFVLSDSSFVLSGQIIGCNNAQTVNARWK